MRIRREDFNTSRVVICGTCNGEGVLNDNNECPTCMGSGKLLKKTEGSMELFTIDKK